MGVVSDAQESIRLAVAEVFPGVPHQLCQWHGLREAAEPLWEAARHLLVEAKQELRPLREVEERTRDRDPEGRNPDSGVVLDTVLALRQMVRNGAASLSTSPPCACSTAARHVEYAVAELGTHSRAEVAVWSAQQGPVGPVGA